MFAKPEVSTLHVGIFPRRGVNVQREQSVSRDVQIRLCGRARTREGWRSCKFIFRAERGTFGNSLESKSPRGKFKLLVKAQKASGA